MIMEDMDTFDELDEILDDVSLEFKQKQDFEHFLQIKIGIIASCFTPCKCEMARMQVNNANNVAQGALTLCLQVHVKPKRIN